MDWRAVARGRFWALGYSGGVFVPFRDRANRNATYEGSGYLLDTIKHADLGQADGRLVNDFSFAYNPSCAYNSRWQCSLRPPRAGCPSLSQPANKEFVAA